MSKRLTGYVECTVDVDVADVVDQLSVEDLLAELQGRLGEISSELLNMYGFDYYDKPEETTSIEDHLWAVRETRK